MLMRPVLKIVYKGYHMENNGGGAKVLLENPLLNAMRWQKITLWHWGALQGLWSRALPGWCSQGGFRSSFPECRWWGEPSTGSPSHWWSRRHCWWKHLLSSLPYPSRWQQVWRCPAFGDLSKRSLETEQRAVRKWSRGWGDGSPAHCLLHASCFYICSRITA